MAKTTERPRELRLCAPVDAWLEAAAPGAPGAGSELADGKPDAPSLRRFSMTAYTGGPMTLPGWPHAVVVDLTGLQVSEKSRPILKDHNRSLIVGHTESITVEGSRLLVSGVISGAGPVAREIIESSRNGFPWQASIGAASLPGAGAVEFVPKGKSAAANGGMFDGPLHIVRRAVLGEVSFVALGADDNTSASVAASAPARDRENTMIFEQWVAARGFAAGDLNDTQRSSLRAMFESDGKEPDEGAAATALEEPAGGGADVVASLRADAAAEVKRIADVRRVCAGGNGAHTEIEARAIADGWDETRTELEVLRAERPRLAGGGVRRDAEGSSARALEAALCLSAGLPEKRVGGWFDQRTMEAALSRDFRGAGLHALFLETIRAGGGHATLGRVDNETIRAAFTADRRLIEAAGSAGGSGSFSTISLTGILSNVATKAMLAAYEAVESVVSFFCAETDVNDFKEFTRYRLTGAGLFEKVGPDGELKHATLTEEAYTNRVETFGRMISLTRQMIINDDLGAFLQIPRIIGRMSALKREEAAFELLLSNPATFFSVGNKNFISGVDTALSIDSLTLAEQKFLDQTDSDGRPILVSPAVLLVPTSLKVPAQQLMTETRVNETTVASKPKPASNPHVGKWKPVASPYLNSQSLAGSSSLAWYLFANPADIAAMEVAYLRGKRTPTIESGETSFNTLGMQWRGYFDFGVAMQDKRAAVKSKGEV